MKTMLEVIFAMSFTLSIPIVNIFYGILDNSKRGVYSIVTGIDRATPFLKIFIIPYIGWYPFIIFTLLFFCIKDRKTYFKTLVSLLIGLLISYIIYFLFQTTVARPNVVGDDLLSRLVIFIYSTDKPYNCFPSIHVLTSYIMIKGAFRNSKRSKVSVFVISSLALIIVASTLFVKQHVILDVAAGMLIGDMVFEVVWKTDGRKVFNLIKLHVMSIDNKLLQLISIRFKNRVLDRLMPFITWCNNYGQVYLLFALYELIIKHDSQMGRIIILALIIEVVICELIVKQIFRRTRPILAKKEEFKCLIKIPESYSFPSGHTASSFAVVSVVGNMNSSYKHYILIFAALVSLSRVYLRVHYPTDIFAAIFLGLYTGKLATYIPNYYAILDTYCDQHSNILLSITVPLIISVVLSVLFYKRLKMKLEV